MEIGTRIKQFRTERNMSQEALASALDVSRQAVTKWESNASRPSTANLLALCELFQIPLNELLTADGAPKEAEAKAIPSGGASRAKMPAIFALLASGALLLALSVAGIVAENRQTAGIIGYADAETEIVILGSSPGMRLLCAAAAALILISIFLLLKSRRRKRR